MLSHRDRLNCNYEPSANFHSGPVVYVDFGTHNLFVSINKEYDGFRRFAQLPVGKALSR